MAVEYEELEGSPVITVGAQEQDGKEVRLLVCKWEDVNDVLGYVTNNVSPHTGLYPWIAEVSPFGDGRSFARIVGSNPIRYEKALVKVEYRTIAIDYGGSNFFNVMEELDSQIRVVRIDPGTVKYEDGTPVGAGDDISYPVSYVTWTKSFKTIYPLSGLNLSIVNKINSNPVASQKFDVVFAPGTLLCKNVKISQVSSPWAIGRYHYYASFIYNQYGWGTWVDKHGVPKRLRSKRTDAYISPFQAAYFPL